MGEYQPRHTAEKGPYRAADWAGPRCSNCGRGGLFIGNSTICAGCEKCLTCRGEGDIHVPVSDEGDTELRPCPTCYPASWPKGFPGLAGHASTSTWLIAPTAPHPNAVDPEAALAESRRRSQARQRALEAGVL